MTAMISRLASGGNWISWDWNVLKTTEDFHAKNRSQTRDPSSDSARPQPHQGSGLQYSKRLQME
jgi:hypothetical protein